MFSFLVNIVIFLLLVSCSAEKYKIPEDASFTSNIKIYDPKLLMLAVGSEIKVEAFKFIKSSKIERSYVISNVNALNQALQTSYVGYKLKESLIGQSVGGIMSHCEENAKRLPDKVNTFEYYDFFRLCLAGIKDSHLNLKKMVGSPIVTTAISTVEYIDGHLYIARNRPQLILKLEELANVQIGTFANLLLPGTEIISINDKTIYEAIQELSSYISSSSEQALINESVRNLFERTYNYPTSKEVRIKVRLISGAEEDITLPWLQWMRSENATDGSIEARLILGEKGILKSNQMSTDEKLMKKSATIDFQFPLFKKMTQRLEYEDINKSPILTTGVVETYKGQLCYIELASFDLESDDLGHYKIFNADNEHLVELNLMTELRNFLTKCEASKYSLIIDVRNNPGGNTQLASEIFALFTNSKDPVVSYARSSLFEVGNMSYLNGILNSIDGKKQNLKSILELEAYRRASVNQQSQGDWILTNYLKWTQGVFNQKMAVLISANCISACEGFAQRFKQSKRAFVMGSASNGTGFGFSSWGLGRTTFRDSLNLIEIEIPNNAFQFVDSSKYSELDWKMDDIQKAAILPFSQIPLMENNPVQVDYEILYTKNDLMNRYSDYISKVIAILQ